MRHPQYARTQAGCGRLPASSVTGEGPGIYLFGGICKKPQDGLSGDRTRNRDVDGFPMSAYDRGYGDGYAAFP